MPNQYPRYFNTFFGNTFFGNAFSRNSLLNSNTPPVTVPPLIKLNMNSNPYNYKKDLLSGPPCERVYDSDAESNIVIRRICFRGDSRRPRNKDGTGVFELGFQPKNTVTDKDEIWPNNYLVGGHLKLTTDFESNNFTTYALSTQLQGAVFFPMLNNIPIKNYLHELAEVLNERQIDSGFLQSLDNYLLKINPLYTKPNYMNPVFEAKILQFLKDHQAVPAQTTLTEYRKDYMNDSWLYVAYVDHGFDVASHSFLNNIAKGSTLHYGLLFAQEVCTDSIPANHIIAAYRVSRDLQLNDPTKRSLPTNGVDNEFTGSGKFLIKELLFNENIDPTLSQKYGINLTKIKKTLTTFMTQNQQKGGSAIPLSPDGYHRSEPNKLSP